ncbi:hypothetical protein Cagg_3108 [Chloroflexus aggregans DSM 9485]|uniref:Uncharacterized protein n=1 Tax=Chloroflexus aggregans (strain MD-66 / DSM 9485) TaxID=326427 RepID=B8G7C7_CHLAD|nr:hypothetical protein Cagg_3104 [Chloroflexus aggregans DSM 9485]ACL25963.1 hypothetical protein Cagg_3105 [Chloroflexus aggregans DSM 9485]ACL25964.1 hypothetical protein Cagg_3106 [Chloroflexus aggregans DSM 9485]ACL25965.1 hypothetical protein Cagg_3107 [Chloroflexus aggregans DSM 9485]ACL25966.1 hypothetical protein Cagg_3108 [Chloroflexus aggregans DSM 9485]
MIAPDPVAFTHPLLAVGAGDTQQVSGTGSAGRHTSQERAITQAVR